MNLVMQCVSNAFIKNTEKLRLPLVQVCVQPSDLLGEPCDTTPTPTYLGTSPQPEPNYHFIKPIFYKKAQKLNGGKTFTLTTLLDTS